MKIKYLVLILTITLLFPYCTAVSGDKDLSTGEIGVVEDEIKTVEEFICGD